MADIKTNNGYFKGKTDARFEFNDKEHERLFEEIITARKEISSLKITAAKIGAVVSLLVSMVIFLGKSLWQHLIK